MFRWRWANWKSTKGVVAGATEEQKNSKQKMQKMSPNNLKNKDCDTVRSQVDTNTEIRCRRIKKQGSSAKILCEN